MRELILGGARSGKSRFAEQLASKSDKKVFYIATAEVEHSAQDPEMAERIRRHQQQRPSHWQTIEEPLKLADRLKELATEEHTILVDCLTLWLSNLLTEGDGDEVVTQRLTDETAKLIELLPQLPGEIILVSNEVGLGIVPMGELSRTFCDESGRLNQQIASVCDRVTFMAAGLPMILKGK
ncbi:MAG: bifunctional adenosylcobinamide kinase/adenosylcobinamide-phosphate guanylyltransferase [Gammaproteobacteria bacterium]|nr:bifunctional adenosylcobinamide kinase/adenosylcobinamide-phosphate guanylyltransferase [Gammaproteobacteria bacterium]